jgi:hypothetical protein
MPARHFHRSQFWGFPGHVTIPNVGVRARVVAGGVVACAGVAITATLLRRSLPLGELYAAKSTAVLAVVTITAVTLVRAHHPFTRFGAANHMTLIRAGLVALVAGLIGEPAVAPLAAVAVSVAAAVELLDGVDGWLARRDGLASGFGARFDMEIDALLIRPGDPGVAAWKGRGLGPAFGAVALRVRRRGMGGSLIARPLPPPRRRQSASPRSWRWAPSSPSCLRASLRLWPRPRSRC